MHDYLQHLLHNLDWVLPLRSDWLTLLMHGFSLLGYEKFILFFLPLGYWAWNRPLFLRLFVLVTVSALLNAYLKDLWQDPRPPLEMRLDDLVGASYGLPSGHAQVAVVLWLWLAYELRRTWAWLLCGFIVLAIMFSRLYLAAHDLEDVLGGGLIGGATLILFAQVKDWRCWSAANLPGHLVLIVAVALLSFFTWPGTPPNYIPLLGGMLIGVLLGNARLPFTPPVLLWQRAVVALIGSLAFIAVQISLKKLEPLLGLEPLLWQGLRGLVMGLFVGLLMPWLFIRAHMLTARRAGSLLRG
ncbi:MAG: phosphatase PAP2 family protein [Pseudomonadaceae bacterium]|nr:phosphatase PAP2 family protein [Pseudomonadaceae bacterium]